MSTTKFHTHKKTGKIIVLYILICKFKRLYITLLLSSIILTALHRCLCNVTNTGKLHLTESLSYVRVTKHCFENLFLQIFRIRFGFDADISYILIQTVH